MGVTVTAAVESVGENSCYYDSRLRTMKILRFILDSMGRLSGRKSMILMTDNLPLTPDLEPGDYYLQVMITDKAAKDKKSAVSQWVDFEIVK